MLPEWILVVSSLLTWLALGALAVIVSQLTQRLQLLQQQVNGLAAEERVREHLGQPVPPLALTGPGSDRRVLGVPPAAPAVVLALSQRCPPCAPFWGQLETLAASLAERGLFLVLAVPESDGPAAAACVSRLTGDAALAALGLSSFPSLAFVDERGHLRGRGALRSVEDVLEIVDMLCQSPLDAEGKR